MAQAKYSKLGYGNAEDVEAAIALGMLDGRDMIITKDSSEFGLMILGAKGIDSPAKVNQFIKTISNNHHGLINCADLLKENAKNGGQKKPHCDGMIQEVIELIDQMEKEND